MSDDNKIRVDAYFDMDEQGDEEFGAWFDRMNERAEEAAGKRAGSSGCGFGVRDMQFYFDTQEEATEARSELAAAGFRLTRDFGCEL